MLQGWSDVNHSTNPYRVQRVQYISSQLICGSSIYISIQTLSCVNYHMRALFFFLILVVVLMNIVKCPGCSHTFHHAIAIKAHHRTCTVLRLVGQKRINKRLQNAQKREVVKLARIEGQSMDDIVEERRELREELDDNIVQYPTEVPNPNLLAGPPTVSRNTHH